jgi:hypothetical protein
MNKVFIPQSVFESAKQQAANLLRIAAEQTIKEEFDSIKQEMIAEFLSHPVTQEILGGADAANISGTLSRGNLFSFIGFESGSDPIQPIIDVLEQSSIRFYSRKRYGLVASMTIPSANTIFAVSPMPWAAGRSWAKGIESGISGLGFYLNRDGVGRSEGGIQTKKQISSGKYSNIPYISRLISEYTKKFSSINGVKIIKRK